MWSILVRILNGKDSKPFAVCVYVGKGKPKSIEQFTRQYLDELKVLLRDGITFEGVHYVVKVPHFTCDAPARAFMKCIAGHCGKEACERCTQKGVYIKGRL